MAHVIWNEVSTGGRNRSIKLKAGLDGVLDGMMVIFVKCYSNITKFVIFQQQRLA